MESVVKQHRCRGSDIQERYREPHADTHDVVVSCPTPESSL